MRLALDNFCGQLALAVAVKAWTVATQRPAADQPLQLVDLPEPVPASGEIRIAVSACGVCRTDLHIAEGDLPLHRSPVVPGHEIVGRVDAVGSDVTRFDVGDRIGIAWLRRTCGTCRECRWGRENLCAEARFTGWDADGGYSEQAVVPEAWAYRLPTAYDDLHAAPLLCAGIIGWRALKRAQLPPGGRLGVYGFGASAHIAAQVALAQGAAVHVMTRSAAARALASRLGADSVGGASDPPPEPLDAAILFAPAGELVPPALRALTKGGTLAVAGIHLSDIPAINYEHELFQEKQLRSVTANTRRDGEEFLGIAARLDISVTVSPYDFDAAGRALADLAADRVDGAAVLRIRT